MRLISKTKGQKVLSMRHQRGDSVHLACHFNSCKLDRKILLKAFIFLLFSEISEFIGRAGNEMESRCKKLHTQLSPLWGFVLNFHETWIWLNRNKKKRMPTPPLRNHCEGNLTVKILIRARVAFYHRRDARTELIFDKDTKRLKPIYKVNKRLLERPERSGVLEMTSALLAQLASSLYGCLSRLTNVNSAFLCS